MGLLLATLRDESYLGEVVYSTAVERTVRGLLVFEKNLCTEKKDRKAFMEKRTAFIARNSVHATPKDADQ